MKEYPNEIKLAVKALIDELEKHHPGIKDKKYEKGDETWTLKERLEMGLYFEFIFMGLIK